jgi:hypothetical protein
MPRPRFKPPVAAKAPLPPKGESWLKHAIALGGEAGEALSRATAKQALAMANPNAFRRYERTERAGLQVPSAEYMKSARKSIQPGWTGASSGDKALSMLALASEAPLGAVLGAVGTAAGSLVRLPGAGLVGGILGRSMGWAGARGLSELADPESSGRNLWWDVGGVAGAKVLGTGASMAYRGAVQPKLAQKGLLAARPRLDKVLNWAEEAMDPAIGPAASNYGIPRWLNRKLQSLGPQGIKDVTQTRGAIQGRLTARMGQAGAPGMQARQRVKTLKSALEELPPIPESNPTITQVVRRYDETTQGTLKGFLTGVEPQARYGPEPVPPVNQVGTKRIGGAPVSQFAPQQFGTPAGQPPKMPLGGRVGSPEPPEDFLPTAWRGPSGTAPGSAGVNTAAEQLYTTVARSGKPLTWTQYAKGMRQHTGMTRKEWVSVLRVHQGLAKAYGEDMDTMIGRMFRGVTDESQHNVLFPGRQMPKRALGLTHFMEDQRALVAFADRLRSPEYTTSTRIEVALHEPIHVFLRWMPEEDVSTLLGAAGPGETEHTVVKWMLDYLKGGEAPTPKLQKIFERFNTWIKSLITRHNRTEATPEAKAVFKRMFTPGAYQGKLRHA